jgi:biopolymer transport protein ExbB/TolQ
MKMTIAKTRLTDNSFPLDVKLWPTAISALLLTLVFYCFLWLFTRGTYIGELFLERGPIPPGIVFLGFWCYSVLVLKQLVLYQEREALEENPLRAITEPITPSLASGVSGRIKSLLQRHPDSLYFRRIALALSTFQTQERTRTVLEEVDNRAKADLEAVASSHVILKTFIWAIPILGFIGTVIGIGAAVEAFSESVGKAPDVEQVKQSIGGVTTGLAYAFDTTLVALLVSVAVMLPASIVQKREESLLARIDMESRSELLRLLDDRDALSGQTEKDLKDTISEQMKIHHELVKGWEERTLKLAAQIGQQDEQRHQRVLEEDKQRLAMIQSESVKLLETLRDESKKRFAELAAWEESQRKAASKEQMTTLKQILSQIEDLSRTYWNAQITRLDQAVARATKPRSWRLLGNWWSGRGAGS